MHPRANTDRNLKMVMNMIVHAMNIKFHESTSKISMPKSKKIMVSVTMDREEKPLIIVAFVESCRHLNPYLLSVIPQPIMLMSPDQPRNVASEYEKKPNVAMMATSMN